MACDCDTGKATWEKVSSRREGEYVRTEFCCTVCGRRIVQVEKVTPTIYHSGGDGPALNATPPIT